MQKIDPLKKTFMTLPQELVDIELSSNRSSTAPIVLFLIAEHRQSDLIGAPTRFFISTFAKTHSIAIRIIGTKADILSAIHSLPADRVQFIIIHAHGSNFRVKLGKQSFYGIDDVKPQDFDDLPTSIQILLFGCRTGNGLAQKIADESGMTVFAPQKKHDLLFTFRTFCPLHNSWELRSYSIKKGKQHMVKFQKNCTPVRCDVKTIDENAYFIEKRECLTRWALGGDPSAQLNLGNWYLKTRNLQESKIWYRKAALQQIPQAQHNLARVYETEGDLREAELFYRQAVKQGYRPSKKYLDNINRITARNWRIKMATITIGVAAASFACWTAVQYYHR